MVFGTDFAGMQLRSSQRNAKKGQDCRSIRRLGADSGDPYAIIVCRAGQMGVFAGDASGFFFYRNKISKKLVWDFMCIFRVVPFALCSGKCREAGKRR